MKEIVLVVFICSFISCNNSKKVDVVNLIGDLPKELKEVSGIAFSNNLMYCIADSGNKNEVIVLDDSNTIIKKISLNTIENIDWEDLTFDKKGNLYIGDFGNNDNTRRDLAIYKINQQNLNENTVDVSYNVTFDYPEQTEFPLNKKNLKFDVEAFFEYNNDFYLFTKNRSKDFDGSCNIYKVPNKEGFHHAQLVNTITTCSDYQDCAITSAALSPDGLKYVLLSHSKIWIFENYKAEDITNGKVREVKLNHFSQKEAICFKDVTTLFIADEKVKKMGGKLYKVKL